MAVLSDDEIVNRLADLPGWELTGNSIEKTYRLDGFADAVAFVVRVGFSAEAADHHPDVDVRYDRVRLVLSTHSEGGVTAKDVALARAVERLAGPQPV